MKGIPEFLYIVCHTMVSGNTMCAGQQGDHFQPASAATRQEVMSATALMPRTSRLLGGRRG